MITSAKEFIALVECGDPRSKFDEASETTWNDIIQNHPKFKESVVFNKTVPLEILRTLATDTNSAIRFTVAMKRKCDARIFENLATDLEADIRATVAANKSTPLYIIDKLRNDKSVLVSNAVECRQIS